MTAASLSAGSKPTTSRTNARGTRSRAAILARATPLASVHGLEGLTFGRLALDLGISKGNIVTLFGSKHRLQLAVLDTAVADLEGKSAKAALELPTPLERLSALLDGWFDLAERCPYPGGPILYAACCEYRALQGPVRDRIWFHRKAWDNAHLMLVRDAQTAGQLRCDLNPAQLAFELTAFQSAAAVAARSSIGAAFALARKCTRGLIDAAAAP